jgi:hypothetical protein
VNIPTEILRGALDVERTEHGLMPHRLPARARALCADAQLARSESMSSGVRLAFRTRATLIELDTLRTKMGYQGAPPRPDGVYDLFIDGSLAGQASTTGGNVLMMNMATGSEEIQPGPVGTVRFAGLPGRVKDVQIWLPHNEITELVALRTDAPIEALPLDRRVWLHHGSSISQGSNATNPSSIWAAVAASLADVELTNLGFSGSALLDQFTARAMRDAPADVISVKLGINLVNTDVMRLRAFTPAVHGFLDTIREGHPTTPLLVVSAILCPIHENTPGPAAAEFSTGTMQFVATGDPAERAAGKLTLSVIRDELARIVKQRAAEDPNLHYLDGRELYGEADSVELPLPDQLHPDTATHRRMGERFAALAFGTGGPFTTGRV